MNLKFNAQCLTCGSNGSGMSFLITTEQSQQYSSDIRILDRILINVGDGCQKYCNEQGIKLSSITTICITSLAPHNISGLPGIVLSLSSLGVGAVTIIGPPGLDGVVANMDRFIRCQFPLKNICIIENDNYEFTIDKLVNITCNTIRVKTKNDNGKIVALSYEFQLLSNRTKEVMKNSLRVVAFPVANSFETSPSLNQMIEINKNKNNQDISLSLFVYFPIQIGSLNHNVIKYIKEIHIKNQLMGICYQGHINNEICEFRQGILSLQSLTCVVPPLFNTPIFDPTMGENIKLWSDIYDNGETEEEMYLPKGSLYPAAYALSFHTQISREKEEHSHKRKYKYIKVQFKWNFDPIITKKNEESKEDVQKMDETLIPPPHPSDITVTMLGTGCAVPSKYRSNSAILVGIPNTNNTNNALTDKEYNSNYVVLDCGSSCASQIVLNYGYDRSKLLHVLKNIRFVWISHHHADHQSGLSMLLELIWAAHHNTLYESSESSEMTIDEKKVPRICVLASEDIIRYQEYMACICGLDSYVEFLCLPHVDRKQWNNKSNYNTCQFDFPLSQPKRQKINENILLERQNVVLLQKITQMTNGTIKQLQYVPVEHCANSFAIILHIQLGSKIFKLVYSGDCLPSIQLQRVGQGCDLLIHEATFDDTKELDAKQKRHCTTAQAKLVALQMQAKHTVLTHFSQRYPWSSVMDENETSIKKNVIKISNSEVIDTNEIDIDDNDSNDNDSNDNDESFSYALDFLSMSFPSQSLGLTEATLFIGKEMSRRDRIRKKERERKKNELI